MTQDELIWRIAGGSGDGIDSTSQNFTKALMRYGLHVYTHRHYPSRIRGGHTYVEVRASEEPVTSRGDGFNVLLALGDSFARNPSEGAVYGDEKTKPLFENLDELNEGGLIIYDTGVLEDEDVGDLETQARENDWHLYPIDLRAIAREHGRDVMRNTAGVGATAALLDMPLDPIQELMSEAMGGDILDANLAVLSDAYEHTNAEFEATHDLRIPKHDHDEEQVLLSASHGISYGAIDEGCRFVSGYPMTPWTDVFTILKREIEDLGGVAEQVEDEIAASMMAIGASHAGAKALTGSSGGGFSLMSESIGLAEMTETPLVMVEAQRAGPSTGMPTKTEQSDLEFVLSTSQGDSSRVVFAPGNVRESYEQTRLAFELAYKYQLPAIVLYDDMLTGEFRNLPRSFFDREANPDLGSVATEAELEDLPHDVGGRYERFRTEGDTDVNPRSLPGMRNGRFLATGNEHWPDGQIAEDTANRIKQMNRRVSKVEVVRDALAEQASPDTVVGDEDADFALLTWGSQKGVVEEAVRRLTESGHSIKALSVSQMAPLRTEEIADFLAGVEEALVVEMNATGQFKGLLQKEFGDYGDVLSSLLKYNGDPFEPAEIIEAVEIKQSGEGGDTSSETTLRPPAGDRS
ncbi:2-oxoacid:acceptor oxidoreductase subunit alpha [Halodesulfurarchaeum sp. HSR-GB]|uniref:2-oxoacid:acceptor oxidoreductase subunit alpha n=1 Tax=Halodesulfurarchaeum sp. HSR-GB TaxID=3074077 RepID=UPI00285E4A0F|nr:2-oxoacid:acceptor oxidoreductase subunit alpha [Halodesulfurarchaeum sp. HSR-GB]MDR5657454.1 2-oxoacid:acceptor oxidoreductase subunit alpha [Halodesulfurarchaeum sp. HSR-GB]